MDLEGKNSRLKFDQDLAGTSRDVEGSRGKIQKARRYFVVCRRTSRAKADSSQKSTKLAASSWERDGKNCSVGNCAAWVFLLLYKAQHTFPKRI